MPGTHPSVNLQQSHSIRLKLLQVIDRATLTRRCSKSRTVGKSKALKLRCTEANNFKGRQNAIAYSKSTYMPPEIKNS